MQTRTTTSTVMRQGASARRRVRRTSPRRLMCTTNGCATFLELTAVTSTATCPICGARRRLH